MGAVIGSRELGDSMFLVLSIACLASITAARDRGRCTAIWSPVKVSVERCADQWVELNGAPVYEHGPEGQYPQDCLAGSGPGFSSTGLSLVTSSSTSQTSGLVRSTIRLALFML